jgi:hypothetical protein
MVHPAPSSIPEWGPTTQSMDEDQGKHPGRWSSAEGRSHRARAGGPPPRALPEGPTARVLARLLHCAETHRAGALGVLLLAGGTIARAVLGGLPLLTSLVGALLPPAAERQLGEASLAGLDQEAFVPSRLAEAQQQRVHKRRSRPSRRSTCDCAWNCSTAPRSAPMPCACLEASWWLPMPW